MNYEKKYREALERARNLLATSVAYDRFTIEKIFPELRESEDEKTRKEIIYHIQNCDDTIDEETEKRMLAWLEKQDKETSWKPSKEEMDVLYGLAYITNQYDEHKEEVITRLYQDLKREFFNDSSYENMFSTTTSTEDDVRRRNTIQVLEYARSLDTYNQYGKADIDKDIAWLEKQCEQKPANDTDEDIVEAVKDTSILDMVEPKFKVGDWVIDKQGIVHQIANVVEIFTIHTYGYDIVGGGYFNDNTEGVRLWTIQDAKDGDVLCYEIKNELRIFIYKNGHIHYHCCYYNGHLTTVDSFFVVEKYLLCYIHPATKEQRDLLFQKMKEAGYEWDAEKKELKLLVTNGGDFEINNSEQKPSWSEEDEKIALSIEQVMNCASLLNIVPDKIERIRAWLKSVKQRIGG